MRVAEEEGKSKGGKEGRRKGDRGPVA